jgi:uncharacterized protein
VVLGRIDAILGLGIIVAAELGYGSIPLLVLPPDRQARFAQGQHVDIGRDGVIQGHSGTESNRSGVAIDGSSGSD